MNLRASELISCMNGSTEKPMEHDHARGNRASSDIYRPRKTLTEPPLSDWLAHGETRQVPPLARQTRPAGRL